MTTETQALSISIGGYGTAKEEPVKENNNIQFHLNSYRHMTLLAIGTALVGGGLIAFFSYLIDCCSKDLPNKTRNIALFGIISLGFITVGSFSACVYRVQHHASQLPTQLSWWQRWFNKRENTPSTEETAGIM